MRLGGMLAAGERRQLEALVDGVDLDAVRVDPLPEAVASAVPALGAITLGRHLLVRSSVLAGDRDALLDLLAHELVHVSQWRRLGAVGFLVRYLSDYTGLRLRGASHGDAYRRIPAEEEARAAAGRRGGMRPVRP